MILEFIWFIWALTITISAIVLAIIVYTFLDSHKKLSTTMSRLRDIAFYYAIGMMFSIIWSVILFIVT